MSFASVAFVALTLSSSPLPSPLPATAASVAPAPSSPAQPDALALRDRKVTFTLKGDRVITATVITRGAAGYIVAIGFDVVTIGDTLIEKMNIDLATPSPQDRRLALEERVTALELVRPAPRASRVDMPVGHSPVLGRRTAPVTLVIFADLTSPSSAKVVPFLQSVVDDPRLAGRVRVVFKQRPVADVSTARDVARLAVAVQSIGGDTAFFALARALALNVDAATPVAVMTWANSAGIAGLGMAARRDVAVIDQRIDEDIQLAGDSGVSRSPTIYVNGWLLDAFTLAAVEALVTAHP